jgi:tetratricopeptide (TPR) repeat protein
MSYSYLGPAAGIVVLVIFFGAGIYLMRAYLYANKANKKYANGDFDGALNDLKKAVASDPKASRIRGTYAYLLIKLGYNDEAASQIDIALKGAQQQYDKNTFRLTKALVLWKRGKLDEAVQDLEDLLKVYETTNVYASLGFLYIAKSDLNKALEFNLKARDYNGSNAIILDNLGTTYILMDEYDKALEIYKEVMKLKPKFPEAYYNYARVLHKTGDVEKELYMVRHSLSLRFWNISTIQKEEVEAFLGKLEAEMPEKPSGSPEEDMHGQLPEKTTDN